MSGMSRRRAMALAQGFGLGQAVGYYRFLWPNNGPNAITVASNAAVLALPQAVQDAAQAMALQYVFYEGPGHQTIGVNGQAVALDVSGSGVTSQGTTVDVVVTPQAPSAPSALQTPYRIAGWVVAAPNALPAAVLLALPSAPDAPWPQGAPPAAGLAWRQVQTTDGRWFGATALPGTATLGVFYRHVASGLLVPFHPMMVR